MNANRVAVGSHQVPAGGRALVVPRGRDGYTVTPDGFIGVEQGRIRGNPVV